MMVKIVVSLAQNETLQLPVKPMAFALAFGPTLGKNIIISVNKFF